MDLTETIIEPVNGGLKGAYGPATDVSETTCSSKPSDVCALPLDSDQNFSVESGEIPADDRPMWRKFLDVADKWAYETFPNLAKPYCGRHGLGCGLKP
ncbi:MAG: hypothetical protein HRT94_09530 [Alphaproteobacteria bacterium]|nr:hypothetical protein [Alphaproteobacteria bacterium]